MYTHSSQVDLKQYPTLTDDQRTRARDMARYSVKRRLGNRPTRDAFAMHAQSPYPWWVVAVIAALMLALLVAAFIPSALRIYKVASETFAVGINSTNQERVVGVSFVMLAELAVVGFSMAAGVLNVSRSLRWLLYGVATFSVLIAAVGNIQVAIQHPSQVGFAWLTEWISTLSTKPFSFLEATAPPVVTLVDALVLKELALGAIKHRHDQEQAFQTALIEWQVASADPERHALWPQFYANAIKDVYLEAHGRKKAVFAELPSAVWVAIVDREVAQDHWYIEADSVSEKQPETVETRETGIETARARPETYTETRIETPDIEPRELVIRHLEQHPEDEHLSLRELGDKLGVSHSTVRRVLQGVSRNGHGGENA